MPGWRGSHRGNHEAFKEKKGETENVSLKTRSLCGAPTLLLTSLSLQHSHSSFAIGVTQTDSVKNPEMPP